jgi:hypothetical protein
VKTSDAVELQAQIVNADVQRLSRASWPVMLSLVDAFAKNQADFVLRV